MNKKIEEMTDVELKSLGYEQFVLLEQKKNEIQAITNNINIIQQELQKRIEVKKEI